MTERFHNILFLCTGNSARSVMAESILNNAQQTTFKAFSGGSNSTGEIHPHTLTVLRALGHDVSGLRSKSWQEFAAPGAPQMDFVVTLCDAAAGESLPTWPGEPLLAHWSIPNPAKVTGTEAEIAAAFDATYGMVKRRIDLLVALPVEKLERMVAESHLHEIGRSDSAASMAKAG